MKIITLNVKKHTQVKSENRRSINSVIDFKLTP